MRVRTASTHSICQLGPRVLAQDSYTTCDKNDTRLSNAYSSEGPIWEAAHLQYMVAIPGITSGLFSGDTTQLTVQTAVKPRNHDCGRV